MHRRTRDFFSGASKMNLRHEQRHRFSFRIEQLVAICTCQPVNSNFLSFFHDIKFNFSFVIHTSFVNIRYFESLCVFFLLIVNCFCIDQFLYVKFLFWIERKKNWLSPWFHSNEFRLRKCLHVRKKIVCSLKKKKCL